MRTLRSIAFAAALLPTLVAAQTQLPTLPSNTVLGRLGVNAGPAQAIPFSQLGPTLITGNLAVTSPLSISGLNLQITGASGQILAGTPPAFTFTPTLGVASTSTGSLTFANSANSGKVTIQAPSTATNWTFKFPTTAGSNGQALTTDGSGNTSWSAGAGTVNSGTAGQLAYYATTAAAISGNANLTISGAALTLGIAGSAQGTLLLAGVTSGITTLTAAAAASGTLTVPATTDTLVARATTDTLTNKTLTSPVISAATPTTSAALGFGSSQLNIGDGSANHVIASIDQTQTLTNKTINCASNTCAVRLGSDVSGTLPFANGGFGFSTATSGGIPYFSSTSAVASSALLTANAIMLGGGAGAAPSTPVGLGTTTTLLHGNAGGSPSFGAVVLTTDVSGTLPVANGGTGITSGTSGGILGFTASGTLASSPALTANQIVIGGGAGVTPASLGSAGTATQVLHGNASGAPTFSAVSLTADITGTLPIASGGTSQTSASAARGSSGLNIDQVTTFGNANYTSLATDRVIATSSGFTAQRTVTLLTIASYNPGQQLLVIDAAGAINGANTMVIAAAGGETINGSASITITAQYGGAVLWPIASGKWGYIAASAGGGSGTVTSITAGAGLSTGAGSSSISTSGTLYLVNLPQGRLTLTSATPIMTATQSSTSIIYYDCFHGGNLVPYYNGTADAADTIAACEVSDTMPTSSTGVANSGDMFDMWWVHSGANRICHATNGSGGGWASDTGGSTTARGTGYTQLDITSRPYVTNKNAIAHCYNGATDYGSISANQATYLGSFYTSAAGKTQWTYPVNGAAVTNSQTSGNFLLWNMYNRVPYAAQLGDTATASYTYSATTWREAHGSASFVINFASGLAETLVDATYNVIGAADASGFGAECGIGLDVTNNYTGFGTLGVFNVAATAGPCNPRYVGVNTGYHFVAAVERAQSTGAVTFYPNKSDIAQTGMTFIASY